MNPWVPIVVALIGIIPGVLAYLAARSVKTEVTTNHGRRLGEHVELISEKVELVELRMDQQHAEIRERVDALANDLRVHMHEEEQARLAAQRAVSSIVVPMTKPRKQARQRRA